MAEFAGEVVVALVGGSLTIVTGGGFQYVDCVDFRQYLHVIHFLIILQPLKQQQQAQQKTMTASPPGIMKPNHPRSNSYSGITAQREHPYSGEQAMKM